MARKCILVKNLSGKVKVPPQTILQDNIQLSNQNTGSPYQLYSELYPIMGLCKGEEEDIIGFFCSTQMH